MDDATESEPERVQYLRSLATAERCPVGTRVLVEEDQFTYVSVGQTTTEIANLLGWSQGNVWMPEHVLHYIQHRHEVILDPVATAAAALRQSTSMHLDHAEPEIKRIFYIDAETLRKEGLLSSQTARYVSAGVELRHTSGDTLLRLFHLSPHRITRGERLWP